MAATSLYPLSTKEDLKKQFVGKSIKDVAVPAAVLDLGKVKNNCNRMLEAVVSLDFSWRAHIKTHKVMSHSSPFTLFCSQFEFPFTASDGQGIKSWKATVLLDSS